MEETVHFLRQLHPTYIFNKSVSEQAFDAAIDMQAFLPTTKDAGKLSAYDGGSRTAKEAYEHYTHSLNLKSGGVLGITEEECMEEALPFTYDNEPFVGHCSIDFNGKTKAQRKASAVSLRDYAVERAWLFKPE